MTGLSERILQRTAQFGCLRWRGRRRREIEHRNLRRRISPVESLTRSGSRLLLRCAPSWVQRKCLRQRQRFENSSPAYLQVTEWRTKIVITGAELTVSRFPWALEAQSLAQIWYGGHCRLFFAWVRSGGESGIRNPRAHWSHGTCWKI